MVARSAGATSRWPDAACGCLAFACTDVPALIIIICLVVQALNTRSALVQGSYGMHPATTRAQDPAHFEESFSSGSQVALLMAWSSAGCPVLPYPILSAKGGNNICCADSKHRRLTLKKASGL